MRDDYLAAALKVVTEPTILVNVISTRVKQLKRGSRALIESLEKLSLEDTALREVAEGKISYELATIEEAGPAQAAQLPLRRRNYAASAPAQEALKQTA